MPSEIMDHRRLSASFFSEELNFPAEKQMGFWKMESVLNPRGTEEMSLMSGSRPVASSPLQKLHPVGTSSVEGLELQRNFVWKDQNTKFGLDMNFSSNESLYDQKPEEPAPVVTSLATSSSTQASSFASRFEYMEDLPGAETGFGGVQVTGHVAPPKLSSFFADFGMDSGFQKKPSATSSEFQLNIHFER